jgi:hypothetical protein
MEESAHLPMLEEPERYTDALLKFFEEDSRVHQ